MSKFTSSEADEIQSEVAHRGGHAETLLRAKCSWERMSRIGVVMEWGDPRTWEGVCRTCRGSGEDVDYEGLEMRPVGVGCANCGGTGDAEAGGGGHG